MDIPRILRFLDHFLWLLYWLFTVARAAIVISLALFGASMVISAMVAALNLAGITRLRPPMQPCAAWTESARASSGVTNTYETTPWPAYNPPRVELHSIYDSEGDDTAQESLAGPRSVHP